MKRKSLLGLFILVIAGLFLFSKIGRMVAYHHGAFGAGVATHQPRHHAFSERMPQDPLIDGSQGMPYGGMTGMHQRTHHGGLLFALPKLILFGMLLFLASKFLKNGRCRHRNHTHHTHRDHDEKWADEIRINPEPEVAQASAAASAVPSSDEMTVEDLIQAMKRLGIKKLEL